MKSALLGVVLLLATNIINPYRHAAISSAAAFRSLSNMTYGSRTNTTITAPSGIVDGDILILALVIGKSGSAPPAATLPAGFSTIQGPNETETGTFFVNRILAWKVASGESGSYTVTHASASSQGVMLCISGASGSTPVSSDNECNDVSDGQTTTALSITTPSNNSLVAFIAHNYAGYTGIASPPTGTTPTFTEQLDTGLMYVATGVLATAGATGNKTQANGNGAIGDMWGAFLVAVGP